VFRHPPGRVAGERPCAGSQYARERAGECALTFNHVVNDRLQEMVEGHFQFYKLVNDDPEVAKELLDWLFEQYLKRMRAKD